MRAASIDLRIVAATSCDDPKDTSNLSTTKSGVDSPTTLFGLAGSHADLASDRANGMFLANSAWISSSSSGQLNPLAQSSANHSSLGSMFDAVAQVVISGVNPIEPYLTCMWVSVSQLVV